MPEADLWLAITIVDLAEVLDDRASETAFARALVARLTERLAPAEIGILTARDNSDLAAVATNGEGASELAALQVRLGEGPIIDCHRTGKPVLNQVIAAAATRWPRFAPAASTTRLALASALPMRRRDQAVGVIFAAAPGANLLTPADVREVQILARIAAVAITRQRELRRSALAAEQLQHALSSRVVIEQAKGSVSAKLGISTDRAFELLMTYARQTNLTLADVAGQTMLNKLSQYDLLAARARRQGTARARHTAHS